MIDPDKLASEQLRGRVEHWKQIVAIQIHFNDLCLRIRWLGLTAVATLLAAAAVSEKENIKFTLPIPVLSSLSVPTVILFVSALVVISLYLLDLQYYYRLLIAAVEYGEGLEGSLMKDLCLPDTGVTRHLSEKVSRNRAVWVVRLFYIVITAVIILFIYGSLAPRLGEVPIPPATIQQTH